MNFSKHEREAYDDHLKWLMIEANTLNKAEDKGRVEGRAEGIEIGVEQEKVKSEAKLKEEKIIIAKNLIKAGLITDLIANSTGLTKEDIEKLKPQIS